MIHALTKPRSPHYHRQTMLKVSAAALLLWLLWEPIRPARIVTADLLATIAAEIRR